MPEPAGIDPRVPRFNQGVTGTLLLLAFLFDWRLFVPILGAVLGAAAFFGPRANVWGIVFLRFVKPALGLGPPAKLKDPAPPRFAMTLGFAFLAASSVLLLVPGIPAVAVTWAGWGLALAVSALALLAAATDLCVGCEIYVLLQRLLARGSKA